MAARLIVRSVVVGERLRPLELVLERLEDVDDVRAGSIAEVGLLGRQAEVHEAAVWCLCGAADRRVAAPATGTGGGALPTGPGEHAAAERSLLESRDRRVLRPPLRADHRSVMGGGRLVVRPGVPEDHPAQQRLIAARGKREHPAHLVTHIGGRHRRLCPAHVRARGRLDALGVVEQLLVELLARPEADRSRSAGCPGSRPARRTRSRARSMTRTGSPMSSTNRSPLRPEGGRVEDQPGGLGNRHEVASHLRVGDGERLAVLELLLEDRHDASGRAQARSRTGPTRRGARSAERHPRRASRRSACWRPSRLTVGRPCRWTRGRTGPHSRPRRLRAATMVPPMLT